MESLTIAEWVKDLYDLEGVYKDLPGEVDLNYKLVTSDSQYIVKLSESSIDKSELDFQVSLLRHLNAHDFPYQIPSVISSINGMDYEKVGKEKSFWLRIYTWVEGRMLDDVHPRTKNLWFQWGQLAGNFSLAFQEYDHPVAHRFYKWNPSETLFSKQYAPHFSSEEEKNIGRFFWDLFEESIIPKLQNLRCGVNYNDAHEHNLLVSNDYATPLITGVIDFGDCLFTHTINELAITCAYACMYTPYPLEAAVEVIKGYHQKFPITEEEVEVLYALIAARLLITVSSAALGRSQNPSNKYLSVSEKPAWDLLKKWRNISPAFALFVFRDACGWMPCPQEKAFNNFSIKNKASFFPVVKLSEGSCPQIDLSVSSMVLGNNSDFEAAEKFQNVIHHFLSDQSANRCFGGYNEIRPIYDFPFFNQEKSHGIERRTIHIGLDFWAENGTEIFSPIEGEIYSIKNNKGNGDYGPTLILKHTISDTLTFYTLYGHLSQSSLEEKSIGQKIKGGQMIAKIGASSENGNWPPHLHFQVMLHMLDNEFDFPGVVLPSERSTWLSICPNPLKLIPDGFLKENNKPKVSLDQLLENRKTNLGKSLSLSYENPLHIVRGYKQFLYDNSGQKYLDTINNVAHVGHQHPRVVKALIRQSAVLNTNTRYLHQNIIDLSEKLISTMPDALSVVYFVNSGSEANELALRMAKAYTGLKDMCAIEVGYHGNTGACIDISSYKFDGIGGSGSPQFTHIVPMPDVYRGKYKAGIDVGKRYASHIREAIDKVEGQGRKIAGIIAESILSCGGQVMLPDGYLKEAYSIIRNAGGVCIADEVQVGFGRTGNEFWAFSLQGVVPDIVTMGKPMGNGHPLAAVVTTEKIAEAFANGMEYFNTFGGNPVSCAVGNEVLNVIEEEGLQENAKKVGEYLLVELNKIKSDYEIIGDVRGIGFFLGIELVRDSKTLEPADVEATYLVNRMMERGVLMSTDGPLHNVIKLKPPMCFSKTDADFFLTNLKNVLNHDFLKIEKKN